MKMWEPTECPGTEELKDRLLTSQLLVLMEGWGTAGKGNCIEMCIRDSSIS